jgi:hypothetical protein
MLKVIAALVLLCAPAFARDDGRYAASPLKNGSIASRARTARAARMQTVPPYPMSIGKAGTGGIVSASAGHGSTFPNPR